MPREEKFSYKILYKIVAYIYDYRSYEFQYRWIY